MILDAFQGHCQLQSEVDFLKFLNNLGWRITAQCIDSLIECFN